MWPRRYSPCEDSKSRVHRRAAAAWVGRIAGFLAAVALVQLPAQAGFVASAGPETKCAFGRDVWTWDTLPGSDTIDHDFWKRTVTSAGPINSPTLTLEATHKATPGPCHVGEAAAGPHTVTLNVPSTVIPRTYRRVAQFDHAGHFDIISLMAAIKAVPADAEVSAVGNHLGAKATTWSFNPVVPGTLTVSATFDAKPQEKLFGPEAVGTGPVLGANEDARRLPADATDWEYVFEASAATHMDLAFLGDVNGAPGKLSLTAAFQFFEALLGPIEAPLFHDDAQELFIFVDLAQWLFDQYSFGVLEEIVVNAGFNDLLPGFFFSTAPIDFSGGLPVFANPYSGPATHVAKVDGGTIGMPSTLALVMLALIPGLWLRRPMAGPYRP